MDWLNWTSFRLLWFHCILSTLRLFGSGITTATTSTQLSQEWLSGSACEAGYGRCYLAPRYYGQCQSATTSTVVKAPLVHDSLVMRHYTKYLALPLPYHTTCLLPQQHGLRRANWKVKTHGFVSGLSYHIEAYPHFPTDSTQLTQLDSPTLSPSFPWVQTSCSQPMVHQAWAVDNGAYCWLGHFWFKVTWDANLLTILSRITCLRYRSYGALWSIS